LVELKHPNNKSIEQLLTELEDKEWWVRRDAAQELALRGDKRAVEPLLQKLIDPNSQVRDCTILALGQLKDKRAVKSLLDVYKENGNIFAARALSWIGDTSVVDTFIAALEDERPSFRISATEVISSFEDRRAVEPLMALLYEKDSYIAEQAAYALGNLGDEEIVSELLDALFRTEETKVRVAITNTLGRIGDHRAVEPLIEILNQVEANLANIDNHTELDLGCIAAFSLGLLGDKRAFELLLRALKNPAPNNWMRPFAAAALGRLGDKQAFDHLINILEDEDIVVQIAAVEGLGYLGDERALPLLQQKQQYDDGIDEFGISVKNTAIEAIERIRNKL